MANIEYGSEFEFIDYEHEFVDSKGVINQYNMSNPGNVVEDLSFMNKYVWHLGKGILFHSKYKYTPMTVYSITFWCKQNSTSTGTTTSSIYSFFGDTGLGFFFSPDGSSLWIRDSNNESSSPGRIFATYTFPEGTTGLGNWHYLSITNDATSTYFFVDGNLFYTTDGNFPSVSWYSDSKSYDRYYNDYFIMKDVCLWTEDFEVPDAPLYEKYTMKNIGGSGWTPPTPPSPVTNILKVY